jgi:hypothetical protein
MYATGIRKLSGVLIHGNRLGIYWFYNDTGICFDNIFHNLMLSGIMK